jgi:hypothetical protein
MSCPFAAASRHRIPADEKDEGEGKKGKSVVRPKKAVKMFQNVTR